MRYDLNIVEEAVNEIEIEFEEAPFIRELEPTEIYVLGFIKGFNRNLMKAWQQKRLANFY